MKERRMRSFCRLLLVTMIVSVKLMKRESNERVIKTCKNGYQIKK